MNHTTFRLTCLAIGASMTLGVAGAQGAGAAPLQDPFNQRSSMDSAINSGNAAKLKLAWKLPTEDMVTAAPLVQAGRVYISDWGSNVYAANAGDGKVLWKTKVGQPKTEWPWHGLAGTGALGEGMIFEASVEGMAYALDQNTGKVMWQTRVTDQPTGGNLGKLLYAGGMVYIGLQSVDEPLSAKMPGFKPSFRGHVLALDAKTGKTVWDLPLVSAPNNGVAMWSSFAIDPKTNKLFFNTGNNYTGDATQLSDSMIAVNAKTGQPLWAYQLSPGDVWTVAQPVGPDYDFGAGPQVFTAYPQGQPSVLVGAGQKNGYYSVLDSLTGKPVWSTFVGYAEVGGGIRGEAAIGNGKILVWSNNSYVDGKDPTMFPITVKALDPNTGKTLWTKDKAQPAVGWSAGYMSNDVYFVGSLDGTLQGYNAMNGNVVWSAKVSGAVGSPLVVAGDTLFVGAGAPKAFAGSEGEGNSGLYAYRTAP